MVDWKMAAPRIILGSPESMSKHPAHYSSVLLHFCANLFCSGASGMVFTCKMPASKHYILNCSETISVALSCLSVLGFNKLRIIFVRLTIASLFTVINSQTQICVLVCKHNVKSELWQGLYSERSHHVCEHLLHLSRLSSTWVSARPGTGFFVLLPNADVVQTSLSFLIIFDAFLTISAWIKRHKRLCHLL